MLLSSSNFLDTSKDYFLTTLIHEAVAHQTVNDSRKNLKEIFGGRVYDVEEGFAKLFSRKIAEKILSRNVDYGVNKGLQSLSYNVYEKNWDSLNGNNFADWYKNCLTEINELNQK